MRVLPVVDFWLERTALCFVRGTLLSREALPRFFHVHGLIQLVLETSLVDRGRTYHITSYCIVFITHVTHVQCNEMV